MKVDITLRDVTHSELQTLQSFFSQHGFKDSITTVGADHAVKNNNPEATNTTGKISNNPTTSETHPFNNGAAIVAQPVHQHPNFNATESQPAAQSQPQANIAPQVNTRLNDDSIDSAGFPWDERIHAGTKTRNADGKWKKRKGVQPVTIEEVEAELRARTAPAQPNFNAAVHSQPEAQQQPQSQGAIFNQPNQQPDFNATGGSFDQEQQPPAQPNFNAQPIVENGQFAGMQHAQQNFNPGAQPGGQPDFASVMARITNGNATGKIDGMYVVGLLARLSHEHGTSINSITDLMNRPVLIAAADALITQDNKGI